MKRFGIFAAILSLGTAALADTIVSPDGVFIGVPGNFQSTTGSNNAPFWNNYSMDGLNMNAGDLLTGSNPSLGLTNYLGTGGAFGNYLSTGTGIDSPLSFNLIQSDPTVNITLLYANAAANTEYDYPWLHLPGTEVGFYNIQDPSQKVVLFAHGTLGGIINNNQSTQTPFSASTFANYGVYAITCDATGGVHCDTYYSDAALNPAGETSHQHFALFQNAQDPLTYFVAFEDAKGISPTEGVGDYNDAIFRIQTTQDPNPHLEFTPTPEPATWTAMGLGLLGIAVLRRKVVKA